MHIEDMDRETLKRESDSELKNMRFRMIQLWERYDAGRVVGIMDRSEFLKKYRLLRDEMARRDLQITTVTDIDRSMLKQAIGALDPAGLGEIVVIENYASVSGSFVKDPKGSHDIDIILRSDEASRDSGMELKLGRSIREMVEKDCHFVYAVKGPHSSYLPLYDLVLRPKSVSKVIDIKEEPLKKKLTEAEQSDYERESELIRENKKKATFPHKFKAAKWTHKNGHPRCLLCGDEETIDGICHKSAPPLSKSAHEYYEEMENWDEEMAAGNAVVKASLAKGSVLDVGCGSGKLLKMLKEEGRMVKGLDNDKTAVLMARGKGLDIIRQDVDAAGLAIDPDTYDNVIFVHSLEHLAEPQAVLKQAAMVAKKRVIVVVPLGKREDPGHKHEWATVEEFKACVPDDWKVEKQTPGNWALALCNKEHVAKAAVEPFGRWTPPKPSMAGMTEAFSVDEIKSWLEGKYPIDAEEKLNGFRILMEKKGDKVRVKSEKMDLTGGLTDLVTALKKIPDDFILDASVGIEVKGKPLPRAQLSPLLADKPDFGEGGHVKVTAFDLPYWKEDLHEKPLTERRKLLEEFYAKHLKGDKQFGLTSFNVVKDEPQLLKLFRKLAMIPQSEGMVLKTLDGGWDPDGSTPEWAKIKRQIEIKVIVLEREAKSGGRYVFRVGLDPGETDYTNFFELGGKKYIDLGHTGGEKLDAKPGDILTCVVNEIIPKGDKLSWLGGQAVDIDRERSTPYSAGQAESIAERGNLLQKRTLPGIYVTAPQGELICEGKLMAIPREQALREKFIGSDIFLIEDKHVLAVVELKMAAKLEWEGAPFEYPVKVKEILDPPYGYDPPPGKSVFDEVEIKKADREVGNVTFKEGDEGDAIAQVHIMGLDDEEADKLREARSRIAVARLDLGRLQSMLMSIVGNKGAHIDLRYRRGKEKTWQGSEIFAGNIGSLDSKLTGLFNDKRTLRAPWKQPRVGESGPDVVEGPLDWMEAGANGAELFKPGTPGASTNKWGLMSRFDKFRWSCYLGKEHAKKFHFEGGRFFNGNYLYSFVPVAEGRIWMISKLADDDHTKEQEVEKSEFLFRILKVDKKQHIVGGIVYSPRSVDSQGDWTDKTEIEQAMYTFMEKYAKNSSRIKVMHKGEPRYFPIIEVFQPEQDTKKGDTVVKAGSWWMMVKVTEPEIWDLVEKGKLTGFSMGGRASGKFASP
jgi:SAM-dependent methyltransferase